MMPDDTAAPMQLVTTVTHIDAPHHVEHDLQHHDERLWPYIVDGVEPRMIIGHQA